MIPVTRQACEVILQEADITSLRRLIVVSAIADAGNKESVKLSNIADIEKGKTGIKDARPGPFPLVVTAQARATCDHFDFEGPAILIPMVSSTGHGDASLKRIHYQEGRYAAGSILAVVKVRNDKQFSARFIYQYLSAFKDELLVSRMVGTANVSLTINKIKEVSVPILPIEEQRKIEKLMQVCDQLELQQADAESTHMQLVATLLDSVAQARDADDFAVSWQRLSAHFHTLFTTESSIDALKQTFLQLAVIGKLVPQDPKDEPASVWMSHIESEKSRLVKAGLLKMTSKVKFPSSECYASTLPASWRWATLGELTLGMSSGWSPACEQNPSPSDDVWGVLKTTAVQVLHYLQRENKELPAHLEPRSDAEVKAGDILFTRAGPTNRVGISCFVESTRPRLMISDKIIRFHPADAGAYGRYIALCLNAGNTARYLEKAKSGMAASQVNISQEKLQLAPIPMAPLPEQHRIVAKVDQLMALCDQLSAAIQRRNRHSRHLADALVDKALSPVSRTSVNVVDLSCYLVDRLVAKPTFGRTAHMKLIYLADTHLGFDFQGEYMREAAGPLDKNIYQVEKQAEANGWYTHTTTLLKSGKEKVTYHATDALAAKARQIAEALGDRRRDLDRLIALLGDRKTDDVQIVATLFAVWNDAVLDGQSPCDDWIIREVRENWHVEKQRFTAEKLGHWLDWMRENHLVPTGKPPRTQQQVKMFQ